jgi:serine/threonine protein kinase
MLIEPCPGAVEEAVQDDDSRVIAALEEYLSACEQGRRPGRSRFLGQHPEIADRLEECLESLDYLRDAASHFGPLSLDATSPHRSSGEIAPNQRLGDYQLLREIGRGGMGVVYEAIQISLGRRVALKLLPFSAAIDSKQVKRFQVEVQAAAQLHHPHIIPVYAVGCEGGTHYFAMQLISGQPLAAIIADRRALAEQGWLESTEQEASRHQPPRRSFYLQAARLGIQAAEALAHAHCLGVVHRDIKPSNLLIDDQGQLWIADFGLARLQGDSGVTATGDLLGTLRYMSPEQALGQRVLVDHRTDQYSLGATLYELITARHAFEGADLQALLNQITAGDPVPPRKHDGRIPRDLETIVLKAMAREPASRYPTTRELADDLSRFLSDRPILARRPSLLERTVRRLRRPRGLVISAVVVLLLALGCLALSTLVSWHAMNRTAEVAQDRAFELRRASSNLELASRALDLYLNNEETWHSRDPAGDDQANERLKTALAFYEQIAAQGVSEPAVKRGSFSAYARVGDIHAALGDLRGAEHAYRRALTIMEELRLRDPLRDQDRVSQAMVLEKFAGLFRRSSQFGPAEWSLEEAVRLLQHVVGRRPQDPQARIALAHALNQQSGLRGQTGRTALALEDSRQALSLLSGVEPSPEGDSQATSPIVRRELASAQLNMAKWLQLDGRFEEADAASTNALGLLEELAAELPAAADAREALASCRAMRGELLRLTHRQRESEHLYKLAISGLEQLATDFPRIPRYREHLARVYGGLSALYLATDRPRKSAAARDRAMAHDPRLPRDHHVQVNNLAWYLLTAPLATARNPLRGLELAKKAVLIAPASWESWNTLGVAHYRNGAWQEALEALRSAVEKKHEVNSFDGFFLAMAHWRLGHTSEARQWLERAEDWRLKNRPDDVELLRFRSEAACLLDMITCDQAGAPALPGSITEALKDPSFRLAVPCSLGTPCDAAPLGPGQSPADCPLGNSLATFDFAEPELLFFDLT